MLDKEIKTAIMPILIDIMKDRAKEVAEGLNEQIIPVVGIVGVNGLAMALLVDKEVTRLQREQVVDALRQTDARAYCLLVESYATDSTAEGVLDGTTSIADLPPDDRHDLALIVSCIKGSKATVLSSRISFEKGERKLGEWIEAEVAHGKLVVESW